MTHAFQWYAWLEAVNKRPDITPSTVRVAIQLARRADNETGDCHPGEEWLVENCSVSKRAVTYAIANLRRVGALKVLKPGRWRQRAEYQLVPAENWKPIARNRLRTTGPVARKKRHLQGAKNDTHSTQPVACLTTEGTTEGTTPPVQTSPPPPSASLTSPKKSKAPASSIESQPVARAYAREGQRQEEEEEEKDLQGNVNDEVNDDGGGGGKDLGDDVNVNGGTQGTSALPPSPHQLRRLSFTAIPGLRPPGGGR